MRLQYPVSFLKLLLTGFALVALPPALALLGAFFSLDELGQPELLERHPDRCTGKRLLYRLSGDNPVLYSAGFDRDDDQARPAGDSPFPNSVTLGAPPSKMPDGDWVLWQVGTTKK